MGFDQKASKLFLYAKAQRFEKKMNSSNSLQLQYPLFHISNHVSNAAREHTVNSYYDPSAYKTQEYKAQSDMQDVPKAVP